MTVPSKTEGAFLLSLDSELRQERVSVRHSLLVQALFAKRVCLADSQIIDSPALEAFFHEIKQELTAELEGLSESHFPMFGTLGRRGADIPATLDVMLTPNIRTGLPSYFSRLEPAQNKLLRQGFHKLHTREARRRAFFDIAGRSVESYLEGMKAYFEAHPLGVVSPTVNPQTTLFAAVQEKLRTIEAPGQLKQLKWIDRRICELLQKEMDTTGEGQTRERLHLAIYEGNLPHYHKGKLEETADPNATARHSWRHLVNTLYNFNLAEKVGARPILNSRWFRIPKRLVSPNENPPTGKLQKIGDIRLETAVYPEYLTVGFVAHVRRQPEFWTTLSKMDASHASGHQSDYQSAFKDHLHLVSSLFAKHLKDSGRGDLVSASLGEVWIRLVPRTLFWASAAETATGLLIGLPWETVAILVGSAWPAQSAWNLFVTGFVGVLPVKVTNPRFKSFEAELAAIAGNCGGSL